MTEETDTGLLLILLCAEALCVCVHCLGALMVTEAPVDNDRRGQQRLRRAVSGADRISQLLTHELGPAACPRLKRGLRWLEQVLYRLFLLL